MMQNELLMETQQSYYDYVVKIKGGCQQIADYLRGGKQAEAFDVIANLSEGIAWLVSVEQHMAENFFRVNSRLKEVVDMLNEVNEALEIGDFVTVADLFEYEIGPMFESASEWTFEKVQN